ncbi:MAG: hypothetical protein RLZZ299_2378 [Pseudomonadota bacterium]|jgi:hypothetical protein
MLMLVSAAFASPVSLRAMDDYNGETTASPGVVDYVADGYAQVSRELALAVANKPIGPGETLGWRGFAVHVGTSLAFVRTGSLDGTNPSGWELADPDEDPDDVLFQPTLHVRKGLPLSLEVGGNVGWFAGDTTAAIGGFARWAPIEGHRGLPDVAVQYGWSTLVGNEELALDVEDMNVTVGYTLPFGRITGIHESTFSPYVGAGVQRIHATPGDLGGTQLSGRLVEKSGVQGVDAYDPSFMPIVLQGGFRVEHGGFALTMATTYAPSLIATANVGFGFVY